MTYWCWRWGGYWSSGRTWPLLYRYRSGLAFPWAWSDSHLRRIGANLNQVARQLNAGRDADVLEVLRELNDWIVGRVSRRR